MDVLKSGHDLEESCQNLQATCYFLSSESPKCQYGEVFYAQGTSFPSEDGCNTCTCVTGGEVSCTEIACVTFGPDIECQHGSRLLKANDTFFLRSRFNCDNCTCTEGGVVSCVPVPCQPTVTCSYQGLTFHEGDSVRPADSCGDCVCLDSGEWFCVECTTAGPATTSPPDGGQPDSATHVSPRVLCTAMFAVFSALMGIR